MKDDDKEDFEKEDEKKQESTLKCIPNHCHTHWGRSKDGRGCL